MGFDQIKLEKSVKTRIIFDCPLGTENLLFYYSMFDNKNKLNTTIREKKMKKIIFSHLVVSN